MYTGIIKTMPLSFFEEYGMKRFLNHFFERPNRSDDAYFMFTLSGQPKYDVLFFYLLFDGAIRYRANIIQFRGESTLRINKNKDIHGKAWVDVGAPVIKLEHPIPMSGFQGFRYTDLEI